MGKPKRMDQIINVLKTYEETGSIKGTARRCNVSKNTVRGYLSLTAAYDADLAVVLELSTEQLRQVLYPDKVRPMMGRKAVFDAKIDYWIKELSRVGVNKQLLYEEYKEEHPDGYGSTQFYDHLRREIGRREIGRRDLTIALNHKPGEKLQLDFAGTTFPWVDRETGEVRKAQVLIGVMPRSQHTFAIALPSQCTADFVHGVNEAFRFFGGLPKVVLSDNLKAFVIKSDRYDPDFNDVMVQLANHYRVDLQAARVRKPKDKASVENSVSTAYTRLYAPLRNQVFHSLAEVNAGLRQQLREHQNRDFQNREGTRLSCFTEHELPLLSPLPTAPFLLKKTVSAKVQRTYHVMLGECKNFYSVPFQHVGDQATVVYSRDTVEIFVGPNRVATHSRLPAGARYHYKTDATHLPRKHEEWLKTEGYDAAYFRSWARKIGPVTEWAIGQILLTKIHEPQSYRSCLGTLALAKKYGDDRLENAAIRCQTAGKATYSMLRNILAKGLDRQAAQPDLFTPPEHENIRGPAAYQ
jgi:transposase